MARVLRHEKLLSSDEIVYTRTLYDLYEARASQASYRRSKWLRPITHRPRYRSTRAETSVINAPCAHKLFHCQLPADGSQPLSQFETRIDVLHIYPILKSRLCSTPRREMRGKREKGGRGWKMSVKCRCPMENARKWYSSIWSGQLEHIYIYIYMHTYKRRTNTFGK